MRERVVVVVLERRERHQRRAVLGHRLRQRVDQRLGLLGVGDAFALRHFPQRSGDRHAVGVEPPDRRHVGRRGLDPLVESQPPDANAGEAAEHAQRVGHLSGRGHAGAFGAGQRLDEQPKLLGRDAAVEPDPLDAHLPHPAQQLRERVADLHERNLADDDFVVDEADRHGGLLGQQLPGALGQRLQGPSGQGMRRRVQLVGPHGGRHAPHELVGLAQLSGGVAHEALLSLGDASLSAPGGSVV